MLVLTATESGRPYPGHRKKLDHPQTRASNGEAIDTAMFTLIEGLWSHGFTTVQCCQDWAAVYGCDCYTCIQSGVKPEQAYIQFGSTADAKRFVLLAGTRSGWARTRPL